MAATAGFERESAPEPIEHASPDVELAEAQLALGRQDLEEEEAPSPAEAELNEEEFEAEELDSEEELAPVPHTAAVAAPRRGPFSRLIHFLQGSWNELHRVQWPDRRQVMQATGVVIGFVIVAGVFLGVADLFAGKLMNFVLK